MSNNAAPGQAPGEKPTPPRWGRAGRCIRGRYGWSTAGARTGVCWPRPSSHKGGNGVGDIQESTDGGKSFRQVGTVADPEGADGKGLCCATLYELPQQVGDMPAGTLLWAASFGQDEKPDRRMSIRVFKSTDHGRKWSYLSTVATAPDAKGLWEPEFSIDAAGEPGLPLLRRDRSAPQPEARRRTVEGRRLVERAARHRRPASWSPTGPGWRSCGSCRTGRTS